MLPEIKRGEVKSEGADFADEWINQESGKTFATVRSQAVTQREQIGREFLGRTVEIRVVARGAQTQDHITKELPVLLGAGNTSQTRRFLSHLRPVPLQPLLEILCQLNLPRRRAQLLAQVLDFLDVVRQDGRTRPLQGFASAFAGDERIAVAISANPGAKIKHLGNLLGCERQPVDIGKGLAYLGI